MSNATSFIATDTDRTAIYGTGTTEAAAIADAISQCGDTSNLVALESSADLVAEVEEFGGAISWEEVNGVAVCDEERLNK